MQEELIKYETAKLAKEKGYDIVSFPFYELPEELKINRGKYLHEGLSAPTQSLLQKWLRETHSIHIIIWYNTLTYRYRPESSNDDLDLILCNNGEYDTYEEALEYTLQEALKLIKD